MTNQQLPAYLQQKRDRPRMAETATEGMGSILPPHISIRGGNFTLVDSSGNEDRTAVKMANGEVYIDACFADISPVMVKMYFPDAWTPDSNSPPTCWSANGVAPSIEAIEPQARTCAECDKNRRGSKVSAISGAAIKACRDEKWLACIVQGYGRDMIFRLQVTPGSFKNFQAYQSMFLGKPVDMRDVITRISFDKSGDLTGVLKFTVAGWLDERTLALREKALDGKETDLYVGRTDRPRIEAALTAAQSVTAILPVVPAKAEPFTVHTPYAPAFPEQAQPAQSASDQPQQPRRHRRTKAEMESARAQQAARELPKPTAQTGFTPAPFRPQQEQAPPQANGPGATFGIAPGAPPNVELNSTLDELFGKPA